jgi:imidazolonepropionase-like amidohydrolase
MNFKNGRVNLLPMPQPPVMFPRFKLRRSALLPCVALLLLALPAAPGRAQIAVRGETVYTMASEPIQDGVVLIQGGKIERVGPAAQVPVPAGYRVLQAKVVTPGLIDAHSTVGLSGILNQPHDQEQLERSGPIQPELRALDAYNGRDPLVDWIRGLGITTIHTGHSPGALISGQTMIVKTYPPDSDQAVMVPAAMIAANLGPASLSDKKDKPPGTIPKAVAMLRAELIKVQEYAQKRAKTDPEKRAARDLHLESLNAVLEGKMPLLVTVQRHQDILAALRVANEFKLKLVLDGAADAPLVLDQIKQSAFPVILHPTMGRATRETENLSMETAAKLKQAGILFALQSGYESYVPKTRVVLFEAAAAAASGLSARDALASITIDAARLLGIQDRVGSLAEGKDADVALFDGDPFEYVTHCVGTIVAGTLTDSQPR